MKLNLESMKLQMQAKGAADKGMYALAANLTVKAASLHEGKTAQDLTERAAYYRGLDSKDMPDWPGSGYNSSRVNPI
jgi:hypothetical protein